MAISTIGTDALAASAVTSTKLASGVPSRSQLPAGTVLQVVSAGTTVSVTTNSSTQIDTGLSATITPTSSTSKILVLVNHNGSVKTSSNANNDIGVYLYRDATQITKITAYASYTATAMHLYGETISTSFLDSPSTTSATVYKTKFNNPDGTGTVELQNGTSYSSITLMEIAA